ncbi:ionotropic receptor 93a [Ceratina calcarata]|uniref:Ionotropic receptor 93a n=2 Tax=Ceratina calcarata TaxID=156304 RepID=A0AAJ7WG57_9HYME|nr:ionotropic receptor 93a [Ceratina calcarata]
MISVLLLLRCVVYGNSFDEFPPVFANTSMAVVIDRSFFGSREEHRDAVYLIRNLFRQTESDIAVHVFSYANVDLYQDYTILLSIASCNSTWRLHRIARKEELVHLAITDLDCPRIPEKYGMSIPLIQPGEELSQIFLDLRMMDVLSWTAINILHDDTFDRDTISTVMRAISDKLPYNHINVISRSIFTLKQSNGETKSSIMKVLNDFHVDQLGHCFLVIATVDVVAEVMSVARSLKLVHPASQWLYVITDTSTQNMMNMSFFLDFLSEGGNVAFMNNATNSDSLCKVELMCYIKEVVEVLTQAVKYVFENELELFDNRRKRTFEVTKEERRTEILRNVRLFLSQDTSHSKDGCNRCLLWRFTSSITWGNYFSHNKMDELVRLLDIGTWTPGLGINLTDVIFPHIAHGFRGIRLPIATYHNPPWQIISVSKTGQKSYDGLIFDVLNHLGKKLNFTYTVIAPDVTTSQTSKSLNSSRFAKLGEKVEQMTMSDTRTLPQEVIDLVREKNVLLAACAYTVNDHGKSAINFTVPIFVQTYSFLSAKPKQLSRALLFASPFNKETWACLAATIIIMGPILYLIHKHSPYSLKTSGLKSSWQCVWYVYGALLQQGGMYLPHSDSARILIGMWWLVVMVLVATYSGSLVAFLTFPRMDTPILTVEDLIACKDRLGWSFLNGSFLETYLRNADEPKYQVLLSLAQRYNSTQEEEVMERVKQGKHVLIDWRSSLRFLMRKDYLLTGGCHFSLSSDEFLDEPIAMIVPQESPYLPVINAELHRMHESGLMNKWISERMPIKDKCWDVVGSNQAVNERKVNVADMQGIFFVLFMGVTMSFFLLFCEFYWHRRRIAKERKLIRPFVS